MFRQCEFCHIQTCIQSKNKEKTKCVKQLFIFLLINFFFTSVIFYILPLVHRTSLKLVSIKWWQYKIPCNPTQLTKKKSVQTFASIKKILQLLLCNHVKWFTWKPVQFPFYHTDVSNPQGIINRTSLQHMHLERTPHFGVSLTSLFVHFLFAWHTGNKVTFTVKPWPALKCKWTLM